MAFDIRPYARSAGFIGVHGPDALDRYEAARTAYDRTGDRAALSRDLFALGVSADQIRRVAAGENLVALI